MKGKYTKSKKAIRNTFIKLIRDKNINKISVSEITRLAGVSRGTFYLHYKDVDDLYNDIEDEIYYELEKVFNTYYKSKENLDLENLVNKTIDFLYDSKEIFLVLIKPDHIDRTMRRLRVFCFNYMIFPQLENLGLTYQQNRAIFISHGFTGVLSDWISNDMILDKKTLSTTLIDLISQIR